MAPRAGRSTTLVTWLLAVTTAFEGLRAGAGTFRMLIDLPARARVGAVAFADFSRATDLSTAGYIFYALYGIGGAVLTSGTWIVARRVRAPVVIRRLSAFAACCSLLILAMTARAAPLMWRVGSESNNAAVLKGLLDRFVFWTNLRIVATDLSFLAVLCALTYVALGVSQRAAGTARETRLLE